MSNSIKWTLDYVKSTKGTHVFGDNKGHTLYVKKEEIASISNTTPDAIGVVVTADK